MLSCHVQTLILTLASSFVNIHYILERCGLLERIQFGAYQKSASLETWRYLADTAALAYARMLESCSVPAT